MADDEGERYTVTLNQETLLDNLLLADIQGLAAFWATVARLVGELDFFCVETTTGNELTVCRHSARDLTARAKSKSDNALAAIGIDLSTLDHKPEWRKALDEKAQ